MTNLDIINGWDAGVLQGGWQNCHCNVSFNSLFVIPLFLGLINRPHPPSNRIFSTWTRLSNVILLSLSMNKVKSFLLSDIFFFFLTHILIQVSATANLNPLRLPGNNSVQANGNPPRFIPPVSRYAYTGTSPITATGQIVAGQTNFVVVFKISSTPTPPERSSSSNGHNVAAVVSTTSAATVLSKLLYLLLSFSPVYQHRCRLQLQSYFYIELWLWPSHLRDHPQEVYLCYIGLDYHLHRCR